MKMTIPPDLIDGIKQAKREAIMDIDEAIEDLAYQWVDEHPKTLWTGLELVEALKAQRDELF